VGTQKWVTTPIIQVLFIFNLVIQIQFVMFYFFHSSPYSFDL
jgi:hypothetical protein